MSKRLIGMLGGGLGFMGVISVLAYSATRAGASIDDTKGAISMSGVAAIVEADVVNARYVYDEQFGPRTVADLVNIVVHAGPDKVPTTINQFGGLLPNGNRIAASAVPAITAGSRYILFLTSEPWFYTPVSAPFVFRVEQIDRKRVVVGPTGFAVSSFTANGPSYGGKRVVDTDGFIDPLQPLFRLSATTADPEIASALDRDGFVSAALDAARRNGASLGSPVRAVPTLTYGPNWHTIVGGSK